MVFDAHKKLTHFLSQEFYSSKSVGFVPTMGALHDGHIALMQQAQKDNDILVVSIFVNPTQFDNSKDLDKYPRNLDQDIQLIKDKLDESRVIIYAPAIQDVYGEKTIAKTYKYDGLEHEMEGANRPGHFDGVGTILSFLFDVIQPDRAYFGEKDYQQLQIVKKLVEQSNRNIEIIGCPIHREKSGLAMSSRNGRLTPQGWEAASMLHRLLKDAKSKFANHSIEQIHQFVREEIKRDDRVKLEYFTIANESDLKPTQLKKPDVRYRAFIVAHIDGVRLIDNMSMHKDA
ncbi:pantoate--beta-alanine ligase [Nonlabens ponticola]|uniref:Pantothenate synthetase n=2 Tax=Nonlabens ponticola TaxID=2496866 RepID=A0A3S9N175_9FLAO|nr:pantoate--beta-alanine ligase [Nonlabens ponticola]